MSGHVCCFATEFDKERDTCILNALSTFFFADEVTVFTRINHVKQFLGEIVFKVYINWQAKGS